jgi:hypothetical protein
LALANPGPSAFLKYCALKLSEYAHLEHGFAGRHPPVKARLV